MYFTDLKAKKVKTFPISFSFCRSQKVFQKAMGSPSVRVEVLPVANKPRYEKSLIGQIFSPDDKEPPLSTKSPMLIRARPNAEPKPNTNKVDVKRPEVRGITPEPVQRNLSPQPGPGSLERASPTPTAGSAASSPTPKTTNYNQSPLASKNSAVPGLSNLTNKKGGKRIKIDLKKGKNFDMLFYCTFRTLECGLFPSVPAKSPNLKFMMQSNKTFKRWRIGELLALTKWLW